ncbi:MAG: DUF2029 domain-containing protein [Planctomycetes bacterium]|nr:DUF2029 domain-containing protein [Planctomycetota bacterium]
MPEADSPHAWLRDSLLAAGLLSLAILCLFMPSYWSSVSLDVSVYWEAGNRMREGGADLYAPAADPENQVGEYIYPPLFAALVAPLTWLPRGAGYWAWALLQWLAAAGATALCAAVAGAGDQRTLRQAALPLLLAAFGAIWNNVAEGQVNLFVLCLLAGGLWQLEKGRPWRGGLLLAAAAHLKVIPVVLLPVLLLQRRFKAAAAMATCGLLLWLAPLVWTIPAHGAIEGVTRNVQLTREYVASVAGPRVSSQDAHNLGGFREPNNSLPAVAHRWFGDDHQLSNHTETRSPLWFALPARAAKWMGLSVAGLLFALALVFCAMRREGRHARAAGAALALMAAAMGNLLFWPHHLCNLMLLLAPLAGLKLDRDPRAGALWPLVATLPVLCFLPLLDTWPQLMWVAIAGVPTLGVLLAWGWVAWSFRRRPAPAGEPMPA